MVVTAGHRVNVPAHDTYTQVGVLLLQGLDLEPAVVPWVIPLEETQGQSVRHWWVGQPAWQVALPALPTFPEPSPATHTSTRSPQPQ